MGGGIRFKVCEKVNVGDRMKKILKYNFFDKENNMRKILMVMLMVSQLFLFVSCKSSIEETYTVEGGLITNCTYNDLINKTEWKNPSYSNFTSLRDYLRDNSGFWSEVWTISEVEQFLLSRYTSIEKAKETIRFIKENGYQNKLCFVMIAAYYLKNT